MKKLWESFTVEAIVNHKDSGIGLNHQYIHPLHYQGKYFQVAGAINIPTPKYGRPRLFQAGTSIPGRDLAVRHVDAIFSIAWNLQDGQQFRQDIHQRAMEANRQPPLVLPGLTIYVDENEEDAYKLKQQLDDMIPLEKRKKQLSKAIGLDISEWKLDEVVPPLPPYETLSKKVVKSVYEAVQRAVKNEHLTLRDLLDRFGTWVGHKTIVGTPEQVADEMIEWFEKEACDGFMLMAPTYPESFEKFIHLVIPILQERGAFRRDYESHLLKNHLDIKD